MYIATFRIFCVLCVVYLVPFLKGLTHCQFISSQVLCDKVVLYIFKKH